MLNRIDPSGFDAWGQSTPLAPREAGDSCRHPAVEDGQITQFSNMSCPRAAPVLNCVRSTLKNGSIFSPSGPTWARRTQKFSERSSVLSSELVMYIRLPSPVTCIMFGCTPGTTELASFGFLRSLTSHC